VGNYCGDEADDQKDIPQEYARKKYTRGGNCLLPRHGIKPVSAKMENDENQAGPPYAYYWLQCPAEERFFANARKRCKPEWIEA
jgi:hypothetical protein